MKNNNEVYFKEVEKLASFKFGYIYIKVEGEQNNYVTLQQLLINENHAVKYDNFEKGKFPPTILIFQAINYRMINSFLITAMPSIVRRFLRSSENISFHGSDEVNNS